MEKQRRETVSAYTVVKAEVQKLSGWQKFWGSVLPASWYAPARKIAEAKVYEDAFKKHGVDYKKYEEQNIKLQNGETLEELDESAFEYTPEETKKIEDFRQKEEREWKEELAEQVSPEKTVELEEPEVDVEVSQKSLDEVQQKL